MSADDSASRKILLVFAGALALILGLVAALQLGTPARIELSSGTLLKTPRPLPELRLLGDDGAAYERQRWEGHWTLVFPGFTSCPDICPTTLALLKAVDARLGERADRLQVLLFSVDPERDTPERLRDYTRYFGPRFAGITAPQPDDLKQAAQALGVAYAKVPGATPDSYTMDHSAALILVNPRGEIAGYLTPPFQVDALVADLERLLDSP